MEIPRISGGSGVADTTGDTVDVLDAAKIEYSMHIMI